MANFINQLGRVSIDERRKLIKAFKVKRTDFSVSDLQIILLFILISLTLLILTLSSFVAFWIVIVLMGVSAFTARWQPDNAKIRKYAGIGTWLGLVNMVFTLRGLQNL